MTDQLFPLDEIIAGLTQAKKSSNSTVWEPGFSAGRQMVVAKLGPYLRCYPKPEKYVQRFYRKAYPLPIEDWELHESCVLFGGFCTVNTILQLRFQASYEFARLNMEFIPQLTALIKQSYQGLVLDILAGELRKLEDGQWIAIGLESTEKEVENVIQETLMVQDIQCRAICKLEPLFEELEEDHVFDHRFVHQAQYLEVMRKNFEFTVKKKEELLREEELLHEIKMEQKQMQLDQFSEEADFRSQHQEQNSDSLKRQLVEWGQQKEEQFVVERALRERELKHETAIKQLEVKADSDRLSEAQKVEHTSEQNRQKIGFTHTERINEKQLAFDLKEHEKSQLQWLEADADIQEQKIIQENHFKEKQLEKEIAEQEIRMVAKQKLDERMQIEQLKHDSRLLDLELEAKQEEQRKRFEVTKQSDEFLQREIELLVLEKQRAELEQQVEFIKEDYNN